MLPTDTALLLRYSILAAWVIVICAAMILRHNSDKLNGTVRRYLAYLGYVDPRDLPGSAAPLSVQDHPAGNSKSKSTAV